MHVPSPTAAYHSLIRYNKTLASAVHAQQPDIALSHRIVLDMHRALTCNCAASAAKHVAVDAAWGEGQAAQPAAAAAAFALQPTTGAPLLAAGVPHTQGLHHTAARLLHRHSEVGISLTFNYASAYMWYCPHLSPCSPACLLIWNRQMRLLMGLLRLGKLRKQSSLPEAASAEHPRLKTAVQATDSKGLWSLRGQQRSGQRPQRTQQRLKGESADCSTGQHALQGMPLLHPIVSRPQVQGTACEPRLQPSAHKNPTSCRHRSSLRSMTPPGMQSL